MACGINFTYPDISTLLIPDGYLYEQSVRTMCNITNRRSIMFMTPNAEDYINHVFNGSARDQSSLISFMQATDRTRSLMPNEPNIHEHYEYKRKTYEELEFYRVVARKIWLKIKLFQANIKNIIAVARGCIIATYLADMADYSGNMFMHIPDLADMQVRGLLINKTVMTSLQSTNVNEYQLSRIDKTITILNRNSKQFTVIPADSYIPSERDIGKFLE